MTALTTHDTWFDPEFSAEVLDALDEPTCLVDRTGTVTAVNRAWVDSCLARGGDLTRAGVGSNYLERCGDSGRHVARGLRRVLDGELSSFRQDYACHAPDAEGWRSARIQSLSGGRALVRHVDTTVTVQAFHALEHSQQHDPLTGLPNRRLLASLLDRALGDAAGDQTAVALIGLDRFSRINESLGHAGGDELLQAVAVRLAGALLPDDVLARCEGDRFLVLRPRLPDGHHAEGLGHDLARSLQEPFVTPSATVMLTASTGVAIGRSPQTAEELMLDADAARSEARRHGGGWTRQWGRQPRQGVAERLHLEQEMREGLARGEFVLHYQPVVDLRSLAVTGVEALVRWEHPDGLRMPDEFIGLAEQNGTIVPLGNWVLQQACRQGAAWSASGLQLNVAVNFSARQISHPDVIAGLREALASTGMRPEQLLVEVTESTLVDDAEIAQAALECIRHLGAGTAIDDFGTGYGSLLYLKRYPVSVLKVDRQFVAGLGSCHDDEAIVASVISLARSVGAVCIAEGVETLEQYAVLQRMGCEFAQGYLFGRPVPAEQLPLSLERCARLLAQCEPELSPSGTCPAQDLPATTSAFVRDLLADGASMATIAAALNRQGLVSPSGARWHRASVALVVSELAEQPPWRRAN